VTAATRTAGAAAEQDTDRKCAKYIKLSAACEFQPVAVASHGPLSFFLDEPGQQNFRTFWRTTGNLISLPTSQHVDPTL